MLRRFFAGIGSMLDRGPPPPAFEKIFKQLETPHTYKTPNQEKLVRLMHELCVEYKKTFSVANITELTTVPAVKTLIQSLPSAIKEASGDNTVKIMRSLSIMRIRDRNVWNAMERRFSLVLHKVTEDDSVVYAIESFMRADQDSPRLWNALESALLNNICPNHSLRPRAVASVLYCFAAMNKGSQQLMEAMEQQVIRVAPDLEGGDLARIIFVLGKMRYGNPELFALLGRQCKLVCGHMSAHELCSVVCTFMRMGYSSPDLLDKTEQALTMGLNQFSGRNVVMLSENYVRLLKESPEPSPRRDFIVTLAGEVSKSYARIFPEEGKDTTHNVIVFLWTLSVLRINSDIILLKRLLDHIRQHTPENPKEYEPKLSTIMKFLTESNIR